MKEFLMLFWNESGQGQYQVSPEQMREVMTAWQSWIGHIALNGKLISTKPIQWEGSTVSNLSTSDAPSILEGKMVTGYLICKADSLDEVKAWAATCPILQYPAGYTEIRPISPFEI